MRRDTIFSMISFLRIVWSVPLVNYVGLPCVVQRDTSYSRTEHIMYIYISTNSAKHQ